MCSWVSRRMGRGAVPWWFCRSTVEHLVVRLFRFKRVSTLHDERRKGEGKGESRETAKALVMMYRYLVSFWDIGYGAS